MCYLHSVGPPPLPYHKHNSADMLPRSIRHKVLSVIFADFTSKIWLVTQTPIIFFIASILLMIFIKRVLLRVWDLIQY